VRRASAQKRGGMEAWIKMVQMTSLVVRRAWLWAAKDTCTPGRCRVTWKLVWVLDLQRFNNALSLQWIWQSKTGAIKPWKGLLEQASNPDQAPVRLHD
jgi:hypothetical protein